MVMVPATALEVYYYKLHTVVIKSNWHCKILRLRWLVRTQLRLRRYIF